MRWFPSSNHIIFSGSQNQQGGVVRSKVVEAEAEAKLMVAKGIMAHLEIVGGLLTNHTTGKKPHR